MGRYDKCYWTYPQIAELFSGSIHPTPSDESIDEKGAMPSHQFNNVESDRGLSLVIPADVGRVKSK